MSQLKVIYRILIRPIQKLLFYNFNKSSIDLTRNGHPLKKGISAVVAMKNEEYTIPFCLESLIGFADQIIIIDNGSEDNSLLLAKKFKEKYHGKLEVDIIEMPGALLGDCREAGLKATKYQWHLRWDADMIAHTDGKFDMKILRKKALNDSTPRTIQLPRINITGDFFHAQINKEWDEGEPILMWFNRDIYYHEYGKFDTIKVPKYYKQVKEKTNYYFHISGLKADINLIHRFHYFTWRELYNHYGEGANKPDYVEDYNLFVDKRNQYLFETTEVSKVKYRYQRQQVQSVHKIDLDKFGDFPKVLKSETESNKQRFQILYEDDKPFIRIDLGDEKMKHFKPDKDDLDWSLDLFFKRLKNEKANLFHI